MVVNLIVKVNMDDLVDSIVTVVQGFSMNESHIPITEICLGHHNLAFWNGNLEHILVKLETRK